MEISAVRNLRRGRHGLPGVEAAGEVRDVAIAGTAQNTGRDRTAVTSFAVHDDEPAEVEFT